MLNPVISRLWKLKRLTCPGVILKFEIPSTNRARKTKQNHKKENSRNNPLCPKDTWKVVVFHRLVTFGMIGEEVLLNCGHFAA